MSRRSKSVRFFDFSGGLNSKSPVTALELNQAVDLQNINILPTGGFQARLGNGTFNSSAMVGSSTGITGLGYFRLSSGSDFLMATAGTKVFASTSLNGTMTDVTGAVTITTGQNNIWTFSGMNDWTIAVGGAPDAPFRWSGSGNAAVLAGSPPSGNFGLQANNYFFIGNTTANPSRIAWSILGDPTDWSGTGSGTQDINKNDGDTLIGASVLNLDNMLLFKQNSIHQMVIRNPPFPVFPKWTGVGAVSKRGIVQADGMVYFVTPQPRMKATDGLKIYDFPDTIDDVWDGLSRSRLTYLQGLYNPVRRQIWWFVSNGSSSTHNLCIIWDLVRKCWIQHTTGYKMNSAVIAQDYIPYAGAYDGKVYQLDKSSTYADASETSPGAINAYWRSGWYDYESMIASKTIPYVQIAHLAESTGTFDFSWGFDFSPDRGSMSMSLVAPGGKWDQFQWTVGRWSGQTDLIKHVFMKGAGKFLQFFIHHNSSTENFTLNGVEFPIKGNQPTLLKAS